MKVHGFPETVVLIEVVCDCVDLFRGYITTLTYLGDVNSKFVNSGICLKIKMLCCFIGKLG